MKLLLYCTKAKPYLIKVDDNEFDITNDSYDNRILWDKMPILNGKIVAECNFEVEEIFERVSLSDSWFNNFHHTKTLKNKELLKRSCMDILEMNNYFNYPQETLENVGYAIHIKNLHIFDDPKKLNEVYKIENVGEMLFTKPLEKAPQNMMRVSVNHWNYATYNHEDIRVLISVHTEDLCKILNGEQTLLVRKKVLKE